MADEKDRFGDKIRESEKAREDQWARQQDAELMEKMRQKTNVGLHCPKCSSQLVEKTVSGVHVFACPNNDGAWLDASALKSISRK